MAEMVDQRLGDVVTDAPVEHVDAARRGEEVNR